MPRLLGLQPANGELRRILVLNLELPARAPAHANPQAVPSTHRTGAAPSWQKKAGRPKGGPESSETFKSTSGPMARCGTRPAEGAEGAGGCGRGRAGGASRMFSSNFLTSSTSWRCPPKIKPRRFFVSSAWARWWLGEDVRCLEGGAAAPCCCCCCCCCCCLPRGEGAPASPCPHAPSPSMPAKALAHGAGTVA